MKLEDVKKIAVIGAGIMGHGIAQVFATAGYEVPVVDLSEEILDTAISHIRDNLKNMAGHGLIEESQVDEIVNRLKPTTKLEEAAADADILHEAIVEDVEAKKELFRRCDEICPQRTIFASNSSSIPISITGAVTKRMDRCIVAHWFNPPYIVPTVEVVRGNGTSKETEDLVYDLLKKSGKMPVRIKKELPGFLVNRVQNAMIREVWALWADGVADAKDIDDAIRGSMGFRLAAIGPLAVCDLGGLELWVKLGISMFPQIDKSDRPPEKLIEMVNKGYHGIKTGKGFYEYGTDFKSKGLDRTITERDRIFVQLLKLLYGK